MEVEAGKLSIKLFGPMTVSAPGAPPVRVASKKLAALLGALAACPGVPIRRETLAAMIWPELDGTSARRNLRQQVFVLKQFLEQFGSDALIADEEALSLREASFQTDLQAFVCGANADDEEAWEKAVNVRTGFFLEELDDHATSLRRHQLDEEYSSLLFKLIKLRHSQGDWAKAIEFARLAKEDDPLAERASFALVRLYALNRQFAVAKAEYDDLEQRLRTEVGTHPSIPFKELIRRSANRSASLDFDDFTGPSDSADASQVRTVSFLRAGLLLVTVVVFLVLGFAAVRSLQPAPTYEELKAEFVSLATQEVTPSNRSRQAGVLAQIAEMAWKDAYGKQENYWQNELTPHMPEITEVMQWSAHEQPSHAIRIGGALERYYLLVTKESDWGIHLGQALERAPSERGAHYARALYTWAIAQPTADPSLIETRLTQAQDIYKELGDRAGEAQVIRVRGFCAAATFQPVEARATYEKALSLNKEIGSEIGLALCHFCLAVMGRDPRESVVTDLNRRTQHAVEAYDGFSRIGNVWGIRSAANLVATHALVLPANSGSTALLRDSRSRMLDAAEFEQSLGNMNGQLQNVSKAVLILQKLGDDQGTAQLLVRIVCEGFGSSLSMRDRFLLSVACALLSKNVFIKEFGNEDPYSGTGPLKSQQGQAAAEDAVRLAKTLTASQIINRVLK